MVVVVVVVVVVLPSVLRFGVTRVGPWVGGGGRLVVLCGGGKPAAHVLRDGVDVVHIVPVGQQLVYLGTEPETKRCKEAHT